MMFFKKVACPTSLFNMIRNLSMPKQKIIELQVGDAPLALNESTFITALFFKGIQEVRLAVSAPYDVQIYTDTERKQLLASLTSTKEEKPC